MVVNLRLRKEDKDIEVELEKLKNNKERAEFTREALRFYFKYKDVITSLDKSILEINNTLNEIKNSGIKAINVEEDTKIKQNNSVGKWDENIDDLFDF
ncbi:hypothetical protein [Clostridium felsineum]|uniref:Uncharacterized protein n=1 Tax=Clostridium felsineum TaxID=36839 RepID=A0A1S8LDE8_9CLOT|nr:hypothetical protein [Clostridium felsineum]MCR3758438.1 hypothetical protein [Clostridium felsineum]URZ05905.1 hypothetical protein CLROS_012370 [Clostridium felsineum]URZ10942.1 hypothetical protein CROST_016580 [Clostridium felsineum]